MKLFERIDHATELFLARCRDLDPEVQVIGKYCTRLRVLDLYSTTGITDEVIQSIAFGSTTNLQILYLSQCKLLTDVSIRALMQVGKNSTFVVLWIQQFR